MKHIVSSLCHYSGRFSFVTGANRYVKEDYKLFPVHLRSIDICEWIIYAENFRQHRPILAAGPS